MIPESRPPSYIEEAAAYVRVSSQEQKLHGLSIEAQKQKLMEYAEKHNLKIVEWYIDEGVSATRPIAKRPALQRMGNDAKQKKFSRILIIRIDRFFIFYQYHSFPLLLSTHQNGVWHELLHLQSDTLLHSPAEVHKSRYLFHP